jgi:hypothetical protein
LGDIGSDDVEDAFNSDPNQPFAMTDEKFVQATQDGALKLWQWRGGTGTFGSSATLATADDFLDLTEQPSVPSEVNKLFYEDIPAMLSPANQAQHTEQITMCVADASADPALTFPVGETRLQAYYRYLGTTTGTMADYELISAPWREVAPVMIIKTANYTLAANENGATIVNPGYICTFDPTTVTYPNGYIVAMDNDTDATAVSIVLIGLTGWSYKLNDGAWTALTTGSNVTLSWPAGATCTLYRKGNEQKIRINGGVE